MVDCLAEPDSGIEPFVVIPGTQLQTDGTTPKHLHPIPITQVVTAETRCDLALLVANRRDSPTAGIVPKPMTISCAEPSVGQECVALGYPQKPDERQYILQGSRGRIEEVHSSKRDSSLSTFPTFRTNGLYLPSMSGGPVATFDGRVVGVVSSGIESDGEPIGYGALVAPILELSVDLRDAHGDRRAFSIPDLMTEGYIKRDDANVEVTRTSDGIQLRWLE